ncbi:MAG TPA: PGPGW domain-containing protein [Mycobacteriales bacterium]|nr:PGPGW domain-containing protein [Mycobacteriales bacterium]
MTAKLLRPLLLCAAIATPAIVIRGASLHPAPVLALLTFGAAVVAASFLLAWAAEAVQVDISGGLAIALLAFIAVLPEYVVDLYFAYTAGSNPEYVHYAAANLLGANQLVLGFGWPLVVIVGLRAVSKKQGRPVRELLLSPRRKLELAFVGVSGVLAFVMPLSAQIHLALAIVLLLVFALYLRQVASEGLTEPELVGIPEQLATLPTKRRRWSLAVVFAFSALAVLMSAEPFAHALIDTGTELGVNRVLLVQWLAPLASEAPEFIVAILLAARGNADDGLGALLSSKVNQWTLLVGSLPLAYLAGGGDIALPLDPHQVAETTLTAAQTMLGFAVVLRLRFHLRAAVVLLALFVVQFFVPGATGRYVISGIYGVLALYVLVRDARHLPALAGPFAHWSRPVRAARRAAITVAGVALLGVGAVLLVAPGPGLIVIALGLLVLGTEYEWARRRAHGTLHRAQRAADEAVARPAAVAGTTAFGVGMLGLGVVLLAVDGLPGSGLSGGIGVLVSGAAVLGTLGWAVRRRSARR